ncbi:FliH/SctL family protein [uncultured Novosphingobium sp.]|uniref:FliH/SctL family protein n=1 Tax=uncultured Novosphingobium sp. TaxID=292277 RepID=UPI0025916223|nr:FliH/SctL family protein [uncultured Novosphingobium sp.]
MSDLGFSLKGFPGADEARTAGSVAQLFAALARPAAFRPDARFGPTGPGAPEPAAPEPAAEPEADRPDPVAEAFAQGFAEGHRQASLEAGQRAEIDARARADLSLAFARIDSELEEDLRLRLRDTVIALCEAAIAPLALDAEALARRVRTAVAMLARADDERVIHLHPDDLAAIAPRLRADWTVVPDPALERGTVRIETASGGVEDGPATWRRAIAEALDQC